MIFPKFINLCFFIFCVQKGVKIGCYNLTNLYVNQGDDAIISWLLKPKPVAGEAIAILNSQEEVLFIASNSKDVTVGYGNRVMFTGYRTDGTVSFTLRNVFALDSGIYSARRKTKKYPGLRLVVVDIPDQPVINEVDDRDNRNQIVLNCSTRSNTKPYNFKVPMKYIWYLDGEQVFRSKRFRMLEARLYVQNVFEENNGSKIVCGAYESETMKSDRSPPHFIVNNCRTNKDVVHIEEIDPPVVGRILRLNCSSSITSKTNETGEIKWIRQNTSLPVTEAYTTYGSILSINNVSRTDESAIFKCMVKKTCGTNIFSVESDTYLLEAFYRPLSVIFLPKTTVYHVEDGMTSINVSCFADCNPPCSFQWNKHDESNYIQTGDILYLSNVTSHEYGIYSCTASNDYGTSVSGHIVIRAKEHKIQILFSLKRILAISVGSGGGVFILGVTLTFFIRRRQSDLRRRSVRAKLQDIARKLDTLEKNRNLKEMSEEHYHTINDSQLDQQRDENELDFEVSSCYTMNSTGYLSSDENADDYISNVIGG